ncbi:Flocculation suppression protein [Rhodotorula toruloides]
MAADDSRARTASRAQAAAAAAATGGGGGGGGGADRFDSGRNPGSPENDPADREQDDDEVDQDELDDEGEDGTESEGGGARGSEPGTVAATPAVEDDHGRGFSAPVATGGKSQASFVHKVWAMLEDPSLRKYIAWSEDGKSFLVFNPSEFAREVLPRYFKHSNFSSFLRQCNFYNWSKVNDALSSSNHFTNPDGSQGQAWEFRNPSFQRGRPDLLARIKRKTAKSSAANSPAAARRRGSVSVNVAATAPSRASKRDLGGLVDGAAAAAQALQEDRTGDAASSTAGYAGSAASTPNVPGGPTREDYVTVPKRVAAGLAEFAPYNGEVQPAIRLKEENGERPASRQHSPPNSRHPAPHPSHMNHYTQPQPSYSPGTRPYPLPASYSTYRYPYGDDQLARQVHYLEGQVRSLADALHYTQQESAAARAMSYDALQSLIGVVASLDPDGRRAEELQAVAYAVSKLNADVSPSTQNPNPFSYASSGSSWPPSNGTYPFPTPRPSTSASQFYYNRVPAVESYTRTSRPDSRPDPAAPTHPHHPAESAPYPPQPQPQPDAGRAPHAATEQATSYPSPRMSWGALNPPTSSSSSAHPPPSTAAAPAHDKALGKTTSLPPLSALLNPAGGPPSFGGRRAFDAPAEENGEPAAKKQRQ